MAGRNNNDHARLAELRRGRAKLHRKAAELSAMCDVSVVVVTHGSGEAEPTVWPAAPEAAAVLQRYAATDSSSRDMLDQEEFLGRRIAKLKMQVRRQKAANDEARAKLFLHYVIRGHMDVGEVPVDLHADFKKVLEKRLQQAAGTIYLRSLSGAARAGQRRCLPPPATGEEDGPRATTCGAGRGARLLGSSCFFWLACIWMSLKIPC